MDGFRGWLEKAVRCDVDDCDVDWSAHTVDYPRFKKRLKFFARRRSQIRNMIRSSDDNRISEQVLIDLLGPKTSFPPAKQIDGLQDQQQHHHHQDLYSNPAVPLSHNLSMDPHSHIGRGPPDVVNVPTQATADYVELNEEINNRGNSSSDNNPNIVAHSGSTENDDASVDVGHKNPQKRRRTQRSVMRRLSVSERNEIVVFLEWEMDKVLMFYLSQWQKLSHRLEHQQQAQQQHYGYTTNSSSTTRQQQEQEQQWMNDDSGNTVHAYAGGLQDLLDTDLGDEVLELIAFCVINVVTAQQILVRYDAFAREFEGTPMLNYYMKKVTKQPTSFRKILFHEELQAIASAFVTGSEDLPFVIHFKAQRTMFNEILKSLQSTEALSSSTHDHLSLVDSILNGVRKWFLVGLFEDRLGLESAYLTSRGQSLTSEMERLAQWRKQKHDIIVSTKKSKDKQLSGMQVFHLTLNLLAAFLYCMNYYVSSDGAWVSRNASICA